MKIVFSRHARRRARLYNISEAKISSVVGSSSLRQGEQVIVRAFPGMKYPMKIVVIVEKDTATVVTSYPLKKGRK